MKNLLVIPLSLLMISSPALADYSRPGGTQQTDCYETVYREEYIPGTSSRPGRVKSYRERVRVSCVTQETHYDERSSVDDNSCAEGSILGAIAGGGAGAALSRGDGRWWAIPLGVVSGAMVGCQIDGG